MIFVSIETAYYRGILLETLYERLKTAYLSDLRYNPDIRKQIIPALIAIPDGLHPTPEWSYSLSYLYGIQLTFATAAEAKAYCRSHPLPFLYPGMR